MKFYTLDAFANNFDLIKQKDLFIVDDLHSKDDDEFIKEFIMTHRKGYDFIAYYGKDLLIEFYYLFLDPKFVYITSEEDLDNFILKNKKVLIIVTDKNSKDEFTNINFIINTLEKREEDKRASKFQVLYYGQESEIIESFIPYKIKLIKKQFLKGLFEDSEYEKLKNNFYQFEQKVF